MGKKRKNKKKKDKPKTYPSKRTIIKIKEKRPTEKKEYP